jgi:putative FmdB family regulatory protein
MPIYEYTCRDCEERFEELILRASDETEVTCPSCQSHEVERCLSATAASPTGGAGGRSCNTFS